MASAGQHQRYLAFVHIGFFLVSLLMMIAGAWFLFTVWGVDQFLLIGFLFFGTLNFLAIGLSIIAAWALLKARKWAKNASLLAGVAAAMYLPFGPFVCGYSFWFYFNG